MFKIDFKLLKVCHNVILVFELYSIEDERIIVNTISIIKIIPELTKILQETFLKILRQLLMPRKLGTYKLI